MLGYGNNYFQTHHLSINKVLRLNEIETKKIHPVFSHEQTGWSKLDSRATLCRMSMNWTNRNSKGHDSKPKPVAHKTHNAGHESQEQEAKPVITAPKPLNAPVSRPKIHPAIPK